MTSHKRHIHSSQIHRHSFFYIKIHKKCFICPTQKHQVFLSDIPFVFISSETEIRNFYERITEISDASRGVLRAATSINGT